MRFWDASALVPLIVAEPAMKRMQTLAGKDPAMLVSWVRKWNPPRRPDGSRFREGIQAPDTASRRLA